MGLRKKGTARQGQPARQPLVEDGQPERRYTAALDEIVSARMAAHPADHWFTVLSKLGIPCGPVNDMANSFELAADLGLRDRPYVPGVVTPTSASPSVTSHGSPS